MNEESVRRLALAQQLAPYYCANPKVVAVAVAGSVARGDADRYSHGLRNELPVRR
jgi:predicted nucleotidyltransferase